MPAVVTLDDVFQIAMEAEETGQLFYEALGASSSNQRVADMCQRMRLQEKGHYDKFQRMRDQYLPTSQGHQCSQEQIQRIIKDRIIPDPSTVHNVLVEKSLKLALDMAIEMEENSIELYRDLQPLLSEQDARVVEHIIDEELQHAADLREDRKQLT